MEKILLVEPAYKNKYPPIGLMKISTYFKNRGSFVEFCKGLHENALKFDKVFVTTLFTFDFDICIKTIRYYASVCDSVYVGGIAATIMPEKFKEAVPSCILLTGQLTSSNVLGYGDDVNIDRLPLDYDMLWDIDYDYPAADSYFIYTTRGCPRKCDFCAVKTLEPEFYECGSITEQIRQVDERFGIRKNVIIMDNNILNSKRFDETVDELVALGFGKGNKTKKRNDMRYWLKSLEERIADGRNPVPLLNRIRNKISKSGLTDLSDKDFLIDFFDDYHKISRFVDFNQGLDARLFTEDKAKKMSALAVKPCRIAFDDLGIKDAYLSAMGNAVKYGIKNFSNYLLYNYNDDPKSLWERMNINVQFCKKHKLSQFSFPMKYAPTDRTDRKYVGKNWHKKWLRAFNIILNATAGIVPKQEDFFYTAYGKTAEEFVEILSMPDEFIRYRSFFEENGLAEAWRKSYRTLSDKETLLQNLDLEKYDDETILKFYKIRKSTIRRLRP